ncbi:MAG: GtrA family protein [Bacteroidales bacterium]|nr:GtrA family protein [Bacteroidales bacterium]
MRALFTAIGAWIRKIIDFFYPPFRKYMSRQFFYYGVTGSANLLFDWVLYFFIFNFIMNKQMLNLGFVTLSSHVATLILKFPIIFFSGFLLQKYVTFTLSDLRGKKQLYRYLIVILLNLLICYLGLKFFVEVLHIYPSISNIMISTLTVFISYYFQSKYTFKNTQAKKEKDLPQNSE